MKRELDDSWIGKPVVLRDGTVARVEKTRSGTFAAKVAGIELHANGRYYLSDTVDTDFDVDWVRTERITEHLLGLLAELHPLEAANLGPFCDVIGIDVDILSTLNHETSKAGRESGVEE